MSVKITYSVMAHPARAGEPHDYLAAIFDRWAVDRDDEGCWATACRAWRLHDADSDYHFVIQDDVVLGKRFFDRLAELVTAWPSRCYSLFAGRQMRRKRPYSRTFVHDRVHWGQALGLPRRHIEPFIAHGSRESCYRRYGTINYDTRMSNYCRSVGLGVVYPFPCLVDHRILPSLTGHGQGPGRRAYAFRGGYLEVSG